ncbi:alpha-(1,3)-fucosyltransferase 9-like isoform X2 [Cynoglossus semilaevis]|uniref:Fucosyltransferase n=2 Tax=Cynoglossus semilaevis TaxID=244447 RepID=A0A3P8VF68_CYNSE|nr:alpha-(1,3)-fucosyltransferase 9-like isoform X2 [Cynoglossus semilaevis]
MAPGSTKMCYIAVIAFGFACYFCLSVLYIYPETHICPSTLTQDRKQTPAVKESVRPIVLLWFWPLKLKFDFNICASYFNIDSCILTDNRSLYSEAEGVIFFHKNIDAHLNNMPVETRPTFQKWIWLNEESPRNTIKKPLLENIFNLTISYRGDADIVWRDEVTIRKDGEKDDFILPKKDKLVCWIVSNRVAFTGTGTRERYFNQLSQHIEVNLFGRAHTAKGLSFEDYYPTIAGCKFYLSFENSLFKDYMTEKVNGPMAAGTVPIVLGPPRENYERYLPSNSFIHVNDFPDAKSMAEHLKRLDNDIDAYLAYFDWRKYYTVLPHLLTVPKQFIHPICLGCDHIARDDEYHVVNDLHEWYFTKDLGL